MSTLRTYMFAAGGTGGHLFPAIAIAQEIQRRDNSARIIFVGSPDKIEARLVPEYSYEFIPIVVRGFKRALSIRNLSVPMLTWKAVRTSRMLINKYSPLCVIGTGGYVSGPVVYAATNKVNTLIHEQNTYPGLTTRMLSRYVNKVCISFENTVQYLKRTNEVYVTGNPVRKSNPDMSKGKALEAFGLDENKKVILVFGGSLGAHAINQVLLSKMDELLESDVQVLWQTGTRDYREIMDKYQSVSNVKVVEFITQMGAAYTAADVVVCRAGATTLAELTVYGKPSILVPYPHATQDHQRKNAMTLRDSGAAVVVDESELKEELTKHLKRVLFDHELRDTMARNAIGLGKPDAANKIVDIIYSMNDERES